VASTALGSPPRQLFSKSASRTWDIQHEFCGAVGTLSSPAQLFECSIASPAMIQPLARVLARERSTELSDDASSDGGSCHPGRTLWTGLMVLDYGLQVAPRLTMALRSAEIVIVDRYRHDVIIDLSAGGDLGIAPRALRWLLPEPDLIIVLDVAEEIALGRKPDTPDLTYLEQRRQLYRRMAEGMPAAVLIDATDPPDVVSEGIFQAMITNSTSLRA
jgi:hypothetical protein